ncbi:hypothetical protein ABH942_003015 [Flavobacterium sp. 28YEA47A]|uniref:hypothetical protein n=1 Tax=Flavobacterium sp. 28YEA47A TaxID=3156276 RepID=UPI003512DC3E
MKSFILIYLLFLTSNMSSQDFQSTIELTKDSDTTFWYHQQLIDIKKLNLINPQSETGFLRISSSKYIVELSQNSNKIYFYVNGTYTNNRSKESFAKGYDLKQEQVSQIKNLYEALKVQEIPSCKLIKSWKQGFDGITYIFELKKGNSYSFKNYWTPSMQDEFEESKRILQFVNQLDTIVDYIREREKFEKEIPFLEWSYNNSMIITKVIPNTEAYKRAKNNHLKYRN